MIIRVMTFNIQHGLDYIELLNKKREINLNKVCDLIKEVDPHIISLNEVYNDTRNIQTNEQVKYISSKLGYPYFYFGKTITLKDGIDYGNALLSKYPIIEAEVHMIDDPKIKDEDVYYETRNVIASQIKINGKTITVLVTHVGLAKSEQDNAIKRIIELVEDSEKVILMGDFNMEEEDSNIIKLSKNICNTSYLIVGSKETYPSINPEKKIDYIFTKNMENIKSGVVKKIVSDHFPVFLDIKIL